MSMMAKSEESRVSKPDGWRKWCKDFVLLLAQEPFLYAYVIFGLSLYTFSHYQDQLLLDLFDESDYLFMFLSGRGVIPDWGPIYSFVYWLESFLWKDPFRLYLSHAFWLSCLLPLAYYALLLRLGKPAIYAAVFSLLLVSIRWNYLLFPKAGHFALIVLFFGYILISFTKESSYFVTRFSAFLLLLSWVRPEYFVLSLLYFFAWWFFHRKSKQPKLDKVSIGLLSTVILLWLTLGGPLHGGLRIWAAISQGLQWTGDYRGVVSAGNMDFSFLGIVRHIQTNVWILLGSYPKLHEFLFTSTFSLVSWRTSAWIQLFGLLAPLSMLFATKKLEFHWNRWDQKFFWVIFLFFSVSLSLFVFANLRHFFILPFVIAGIWPVHFRKPREKKLFQGAFFSQAGVPIFALICWLGPIAIGESTSRTLWPNEDRKNIEYLRSMDPKNVGHCLSFPQSTALYLPHLCRSVEAIRSAAFHGELGILQQVKMNQPTHVFIRGDFWLFGTQPELMAETFGGLQELGYRKIKLPHGEIAYWFTLSRESSLDAAPMVLPGR